MSARPIRTAVVKGHAPSLEAIRRYLPSNYAADVDGQDVKIRGFDNLGWTLDDYVIPRLASGLYRAIECQHPDSEPCEVTADPCVVCGNPTNVGDHSHPRFLGSPS
jgi:hypothetical protein